MDLVRSQRGDGRFICAKAANEKDLRPAENRGQDVILRATDLQVRSREVGAEDRDQFSSRDASAGVTESIHDSAVRNGRRGSRRRGPVQIANAVAVDEV